MSEPSDIAPAILARSVSFTGSALEALLGIRDRWSAWICGYVRKKRSSRLNILTAVAIPRRGVGASSRRRLRRRFMLDNDTRNPIYRSATMVQDYNSYLPLSPATLHILLALAAEDRHGYGIMQEVARQSSGKYKLGPGTLYDNLRRLMNEGLVEEVSRRSTKEDPRRRYYRLTSFGRGVLAAEIARLQGVVREAKLHLYLPNPRRV